MDKDHEKSELLWKILESRDRSLKQGLHRWDKQDQEIGLLRKTLEERNLESNEKDKEISALKRTLDVRLEKLKELERIRSSWPYQLLHTIRHPRKIFKSRATNDKMSSLKEKK